VLLWAVVEFAVGYGRHTRFGPGLVGAIFPLLVLEAWVAKPQRWRIRFFHLAQVAVPTCLLLVLNSVTLGSCCICDHSPWARTLRVVEFIYGIFRGGALATLPGFALLVALRPRLSSSAERKAYVRTTQVAVLAVLLVAVMYGSFLWAEQRQFPYVQQLQLREAAERGY
jgi:hypothetical protein